MRHDRNTSLCTEKTFLIYKKLCLAPVSKDDISIGISDDTLNLYLSTLEKLNVQIQRPSKKHPFYSIKNNINFIGLNEKDIKLLSRIKTILENVATHNEVINYNVFLANLTKYTDNFYAKELEKIISKGAFGKNLHEKINLLSECIHKKENLLIEYDSPVSHINFFEVLPIDIKIENSKTYLTCFNNNAKQTKSLRIDRIKKIKIIHKRRTKNQTENFAICKFSNIKSTQITSNFTCNIIENNERNILAKIIFDNEFEFIQKILSFGINCQIIEPEYLQIKIKNILESIRSNYSEKI